MTRITQRSQFVTSEYKTKLLKAMEFRNRFAERPFLSSSLMPTEEIMTLYEEIDEVSWPKNLDNPKCCIKETESKSLKLISLDEHASVTLSEHGKGFSVQYLARLSQPGQKYRCNKKDTGSSILSDISNISDTGAKNQTRDDKTCWQYTWTIQHHVVADCPSPWQHPLDLLLEYQQRNSGELENSENSITGVMKKLPKKQDAVVISELPKALPLRCCAHHLHKWRKSGEYVEGDDDLTAGRVKVICSDGIIYRLHNKPVMCLEVYPGDGSVMVSQGYEGDYFSHYIPRDSEIEERTYSASKPPPDGAKINSTYSLKKILLRGQRILRCAIQSRLNLSVVKDKACWQVNTDIVKPPPTVILEEEEVPNIGKFSLYSNGKIRIVFTDRTSLDISVDISRAKTQMTEIPDMWSVSNFFPNSCRLFLPNGQYYYADTTQPENYKKYIDYAKNWLTWCVTPKEERAELFRDVVEEDCHTVAVTRELQKIRCFNYILDNVVLKSTSLEKEPDERSLAMRSLCNTQPVAMSEEDVMEALKRTSLAIKDIDNLVSDKLSH